MPEAIVNRPTRSADMPGCVRSFGKGGRTQGPTQTLNNGWGRDWTARAVGTAEASAGSIFGASFGRFADSIAEGSPAGLIVDVVVREVRRGSGTGWGWPGNQAGRLGDSALELTSTF